MKLKIIIGSTREGRSSDRAAKWIANHIDKDIEAEILDLRWYDMPFFNDAVSPQHNQNRKPEGAVKKWLDKLAEADGTIIVTPEYNRSIPAVLKNALDQVAYELQGKAVGIVAHGSSGGAQAVAHLRSIIPGVLAYSAPTAIYMPGMAGMILDENGDFKPDYASHEDRLASALEKQVKEILQIHECNCQTCTCTNGRCGT